MASFKSFRIMGKATTSRREFLRLVPSPEHSIPPELGLHATADLGNSLGLTAGDSTLLAGRMLTALDTFFDLRTALLDVGRDFNSGRIRTVGGIPMCRVVSQRAAQEFLVRVCQWFRPDIAAAYEPSEGG